jgi:4-aminobutyrate aminotransferase-like enzyme
MNTFSHDSISGVAPDRVFMGMGDFVYRDGVTVPICASQRCELIDLDGRRFLDAEAANGTAAFGYDSSILVEASKIVSSLPLLPSFIESCIRLRAASELCDWFRCSTGLPGRVAFELGGAQGIELALKIARCNNSGNAIAVFEGAYHGRSIFTSHLSASWRYRNHRFDQSAQILRLPHPDSPHWQGQDRSEYAQRCIQHVTNALSNEMSGAPSSWNALLVEPVLNVGGMSFPEPEYLNRVVELFRERGALIIVDEIFSGFYRTGVPLGLNRYEFQPDIVIVSKGLSHGIVPLSCVWARESLLSVDNFPPGSHSVTYANSPLNMAVATTVLRRYKAWSNIESDLKLLELRLTSALKRLSERHSIILEVECHGATARIVLREPVAARVRKAARSIGSQEAIDGYSGLLVASTGMAPNIISIHPPLIFSEEDVWHMEQMLDLVLRQV